jgi:hypothetical protein
MAFCDAASNIRLALGVHHVIDTQVDPSLFELNGIL